MAPSLNKQKEKAWTDLIKQEAKISGWKFKSWFAYRVSKGFFYKVNFWTYGYGNSISGSLSFKPLLIDELFWDIVDLSDNRKMPLSFRGNGAFVVSSIEVFSFSFNVVPDTLKFEIDDLFEKVNFKILELESSVTNLDSFVSFIEQYEKKESDWFDVDMLIVASIAQKKYDKALSLIYSAKEKRGRARWGFGDNDFYDLAIMYAKERITTDNHPH